MAALQAQGPDWLLAQAPAALPEPSPWDSAPSLLTIPYQSGSSAGHISLLGLYPQC